MNCEELKASAHDYFLRLLSAEQCAQFDRHAESCPACGEFVRVCRETTCREVNEFLAGYVEGQLTADRTAVFERHLAICPDCRNYLDAYRATLRAARSSHSPGGLGVPAQMPDQLVQAILRSAARER